MITSELIDALLSISESMSEEEKNVIERASEILIEHQNKVGKCGAFESRVTAIGHTYYAAIGVAVKELDLAPRDRIRVTVEKL